MNLAALFRYARLSLRAEGLIAEIRLRLAARRMALLGFAALTALMALAFVNIALYAFLLSLWGPVLTPAAIALFNLGLALMALIGALLSKPGAELAGALELRKTASEALEEELRAVSGAGSLLAGLAGGGESSALRLLVPALTAIIGALGRRKAKPDAK